MDAIVHMKLEIERETELEHFALHRPVKNICTPKEPLKEP